MIWFLSSSFTFLKEEIRKRQGELDKVAGGVTDKNDEMKENSEFEKV